MSIVDLCYISSSKYQTYLQYKVEHVLSCVVFWQYSGSFGLNIDRFYILSDAFECKRDNCFMVCMALYSQYDLHGLLSERDTLILP